MRDYYNGYANGAAECLIMLQNPERGRAVFVPLALIEAVRSADQKHALFPMQAIAKRVRARIELADAILEQCAAYERDDTQ